MCRSFRKLGYPRCPCFVYLLPWLSSSTDSSPVSLQSALRWRSLLLSVAPFILSSIGSLTFTPPQPGLHHFVLHSKRGIHAIICSSCDSNFGETGACLPLYVSLSTNTLYPYWQRSLLGTNENMGHQMDRSAARIFFFLFFSYVEVDGRREMESILINNQSNFSVFSHLESSLASMYYQPILALFVLSCCSLTPLFIFSLIFLLRKSQGRTGIQAFPLRR